MAEFEALIDKKKAEKVQLKEKQENEKQKLEEAKQEDIMKGGWTKEEMQLLTKGITRFPQGTVNRWY